MIRKLMAKIRPPHKQRGQLEPHMVKRLVRGVMTARPDEIDCRVCFEQLDCFVEMELAGKNAAQAMPLVQDHLDRCQECRDEFEALLTVLRTLA